MLKVLFGVPNQSFFDSIWAAVHFSSGLLIGLAVIHYVAVRGGKLTARSYTRISLLLLILWEYFELSLRYMDRHRLRIAEYLDIILPKSFFEIESILNIASDLILGSIGLYLAYRYARSGRGLRLPGKRW